MGYLLWIWETWKMPMFCFAALLIIQAMLYIWEEYRQNNWFMPRINVTGSESTEIVSLLSSLSKLLITQVLVVTYPWEFASKQRRRFWLKCAIALLVTPKLVTAPLMYVHCVHVYSWILCRYKNVRFFVRFSSRSLVVSDYKVSVIRYVLVTFIM